MAGDWRGIPGNEHVFAQLSAVIASGGAIAFVGAGALPAFTRCRRLIRRLAKEAVAPGLNS